MSCNDNGIFLYHSEDKTIYYLRTLRYDFIFTMKNEIITITIDNSIHEIKWCNDEDTYNVYSILKLYKRVNEVSDENHSKLICIYNYDNIIQVVSKHKNNDKVKTYINKYFTPFTNDILCSISALQYLSDEYKVYYYTILNKYNDKYILTNISDVLALLINCLYYNSPF